jgi:hypothetical protein
VLKCKSRYIIKMEDEYSIVKIEDECSLCNYVMYKICPKNKDLNYCYIGQTTNFAVRKNQHIKNTINVRDTKHYHLKQYEVIRQNGGWDEWEMIEIEQLNGKTKLEVRKREQELIEQYNANLNTLNAFITEDKRASTKKAITEKYREENKEFLKEQTKQYKQNHKEIIAEQMKKYRAENKEKLTAQKKEYYEKNKEKMDRIQKEWREENKEIQKEKRKMKTAKLKEEKLAQMALLEKPDTEEEKLKKEQMKKEKRAQYNEQRNTQRRLNRAQEKEKLKNITTIESTSDII